MSPHIQHDLTEHSNTFPEIEYECLIPLDSKIREIEKKFNKENQIIILEGTNGSGKTTHLAQFVEAHSDSCFSYFLTNNYWTWRQSNFLLSLCAQMSCFLGQEIQLEDGFLSDTEKAKTYFETLVHQVTVVAKQQKRKLYFVIDGLEWAFEGTKGERIIDILPQTSPKGLYFLGSVSLMFADRLPFKHQKDEPRTFSILETETYLADLNLDRNTIENIHSISGGIPGYLAAVRRLVINDKITLEQILSHPSETEELLEIQWKSSNVEQNDLKDIVGLLAFSLVPLSYSILSQITGIEPNTIKEYLVNTGLFHLTPGGNLEFFPELIKQIAEARLSNIKETSLQKLTTYYENQQDEKSANLLLPEYYRISKNYSAIRSLIIPERIGNVIEQNNDLNIIKRNVRYATELAYSNNEEETFNFAILSSQLNTLSNKLIGETEVEALISINQFERALELAYSSRLIRTRIRLLANIYTAMEQKGVTVSRKAISELSQMVDNFDCTNIDPEEKLSLAADLYPILPDIATTIVDDAKSKQGEASEVDLIFMLNMLQGKNSDDTNIFDNIKSEKIRDVALTHSPWLSKLTVDELERKLSQVSKTKTKEYILRQWCLQNRKHPEVAKVIDWALDVIIADPDYHVPLRHLRQLSDVIMYCPKEEIHHLARRFDVPNFVSLESPVQEKVRFELNLVEALIDVSITEAIERFQRVYDYLQQKQMDNDVACFCYVKLWTTWKALPKLTDERFDENLKTRIEDEFIELINTSADQLNLSKKILRALTRVDVFEGITFAEMLNTVDRREKALHEVLVAYFRQDRIPVDLEISNSILNKIKDKQLQDRTIIRVIDAANRTGKIDNKDVNKFIFSQIERISDPLSSCQGIAKLISGLENEKENLITNLKEKLFDSLSLVDPVWVRVELAFDLVTIIAEGDRGFASELYEKARALRDQSILANQTIAVMFFQLLNLAAQISTYLDLKQESDKATWDLLLQMVSALPSYVVRAYVYAQLAGGRYYAGDIINFNNIVQNFVLRDLSTATRSQRTDEIIREISWVIFEYSIQETQKVLDKLSYIMKEQAWTEIAFRILTKTNVGEKILYSDLNLPIDLQSANKILTILENIEIDINIWIIVDNLARAISNKESNLVEGQRLDLLVKLEELVEKKLPDLKNITHEGYKVLCLGAIERAFRKSASKSRGKIKKQHAQIIADAKGIQNIADRTLVLASLPDNFSDIDKKIAGQLLEQALQDVSSIPNVKDRISRLEAIADSYNRMHDSDRALNAINLAENLAEQLDGMEKDQILSSLIQTTHQINPDIAAEMTEKIDDMMAGYLVDTIIKSRILSKSPNKLLIQSNEKYSEEIIRRAAVDLSKNLLSGKGVVSSRKVILHWLKDSRFYVFDTGIEIARWAAESLLRQTPTSKKGKLANRLIEHLIQNCQYIVEIGNHTSFLSEIPKNIKTGFEGLSTNHIYFGIGDRDKAINWIKDWLLTNANEYVKICDPYFDTSQLWVLKTIPTDTNFYIITTGKKLGLKEEQLDDSQKPGICREKLRKDKQVLSQKFMDGWDEISNQAPPPTLVIVHSSIYGSEEQDEFHDRFIITKGAGLSIGTSLNGIGNKEFFITLLTNEDVSHVEEVYLDPKLNLQDFFSSVIYFELADR